MSKNQSLFPLFKSKFDRPMAQLELVAATGLTQTSVSRFLCKMMDAEPRQAHISDWRASKHVGGPPIAIYSPEEGEDLACTIRKLSGAERLRRYRTNHQREEEPTQEVHPHCDFPLPRPHYLTVALFGMAA